MTNVRRHFRHQSHKERLVIIEGEQMMVGVFVKNEP